MHNQNRITVIKPRTGWRDINLKELWLYRDLIYLFVRRNFTIRYKQTVLGPAWIFIAPLLTTFISTFIFGNIAKIPSDGVPYFLFYMCGNTLWSYFSHSLVSTSNTFVNNAALFGKVYFPRLVTPISSVITGIMDFFIQLVLFIGFLIYFIIIGADVAPNLYILLLPVILLETAALSLGFGIIISSLTAKYRDLTVLVNFGMTLWMYVTPIIYSTTALSGSAKVLVMLNPMAPLIEIMRYAFLGTGNISFGYFGISILSTIVILAIGTVLFSRIEKAFMDTV